MSLILDGTYRSGFVIGQAVRRTGYILSLFIVSNNIVVTNLTSWENRAQFHPINIQENHTESAHVVNFDYNDSNSASLSIGVTSHCS